MKKLIQHNERTIICLHAAQANVDIINESQVNKDVILRHKVDTYLMQLIREQHPLEQQIQYVKHKFTQILMQQPSAILVTCTNYIVLLDQIELQTDIPILKVDELLFEQIKSVRIPIKLLFSNQNTIQGTMARLQAAIPSQQNIEVVFVPEIFDWYLVGERQRHDDRLLSILRELDDGSCALAVGQLSMAPVAERYAKESGNIIVSAVTAFQHNSILYK